MLPWILAAVTAVLTLALAALGVSWLLPNLVRNVVHRLLNAPISDTLAELFVSTLSTPPLDLLYLSLRSKEGGVVIRPMGSPKPVKGLDDLSLISAQLATQAVPEGEPVELKTLLGRHAKRPLEIEMPIMVSGMAYGLALTKEARLALAKGTADAGTALSSGQGPFLAEERRLAKRYIQQFGRWDWNRDVKILRQADMIEVQVGQGAMPGNAVLSSPGSIGDEVRTLMGLGPDDPPVIHSNLYLNTKTREPVPLSEVVRYLRSVTDGVPIAVKMGATDALERDLDVALEAEVDVVVLDGTEGATGNAPITLSDHFGLPTMVALGRAMRHLERVGALERVDVVVSGGLREPGDFLKALALGARAVGIGTAAMFAISHFRLMAALPYYPPTDLVFYRANPKIGLDVDLGAKGLTNFLHSCAAEMRIALRTMGHRSVHELSLDDLVTLDRDVAEITGARLGLLGPQPAGPLIQPAGEQERRPS